MGGMDGVEWGGRPWHSTDEITISDRAADRANALRLAQYELTSCGMHEAAEIVAARADAEEALPATVIRRQVAEEIAVAVDALGDYDPLDTAKDNPYFGSAIDRAVAKIREVGGISTGDQTS